MATQRIYAYLRKSTVDQKTKGQELTIRKYADEVTVEQAPEKMSVTGRDARFEGKNTKNLALGLKPIPINPGSEVLSRKSSS